MSEEKDSQTPDEKPIAPKTPKKPVAPKKPAFNPFAGKTTNFKSSKAGNPGNKGKMFKGGGMKKGT
jgi:hypothetical protein